jgi:hypothetical protein
MPEAQRQAVLDQIEKINNIIKTQQGGEVNSEIPAEMPEEQVK